MPHLDVSVPYPGAIISINHYKDQRSHGHHTRVEATRWMNNLALMARAEANRLGIEVKPPLIIRLSGWFKDWRSVPDLHNLHKVIGDALQQAFFVNDQLFRFEDGEIAVGTHDPMLRIEVEILR